MSITTRNTPMNSASTPTATSTAAILTPRGRGAVATVRLIGDCRLIDQPTPSLFRAANGKPVEDQPINRIVFGQWGREVGEDVVLCRTADNITEIHCHGGEAAAAAILADLQSCGCRAISWVEQSELTTGLFETECLEALTKATTARTADLLLEQQSGVLRFGIKQVLQTITEGKGDSSQTAIDRLDAMLHWADFGLHLSQPWQVVIAGRPNVGKSSLINALLGFSRSIVYDRPGTTRDVVTAETAFEGWPIRFSDTAGLRDDGDAIEMAGMERARERLATADCRVLLFDTSRDLHEDDRSLLSEWPDAIRIAHKCDLPNVWNDAVLDSAIRVSSVVGTGLDELAQILVSQLIPQVPASGTPIPVCERQVDLIGQAREQLASNDPDAAFDILSDLLL